MQYYLQERHIHKLHHVMLWTFLRPREYFTIRIALWSYFCKLAKMCLIREGLCFVCWAFKDQGTHSSFYARIRSSYHQQPFVLLPYAYSMHAFSMSCVRVSPWKLFWYVCSTSLWKYLPSAAVTHCNNTRQPWSCCSSHNLSNS